MSDEQHRRPLPAAWGEQLPLWTEPLRTPAGCAATLFVLCCFLPIFLFQIAARTVQGVIDREQPRLSRFDDYVLGMAAGEFDRLTEVQPSITWERLDLDAFEPEPKHQFIIKMASPDSNWTTLTLTFEQPVDKSLGFDDWPLAPNAFAMLTQIELDRIDEISDEERGALLKSLEERFGRWHSDPDRGLVRWPQVTAWDGELGAESEVEVYFRTPEGDAPTQGDPCQLLMQPVRHYEVD